MAGPYFDHAATSLPRDERAVQAALAAAEWANPGRGTNSLQARACDAVEEARRAVAELADGGTVCFTSGATQALNQAILGWRPRPIAVAVDPLAHNAVRRPLMRLGASLWTLPHDARGRVDPARLRGAWVSGTSLVVVTHGSNVCGLLQPVADIAEVACGFGAQVLVDAAQTAGVAPLVLGEVSCVAFSAHKGLKGLPGAGALVIRDDVDLDPLVVGGTGGSALEDDMPEELPARLEAGTPNLPGIAAFGAAARAAGEHAWSWREAARALRDAVLAAGITRTWSGELPVVSFLVDGQEPHETEELLDRGFGITTRAGLHCAPSAHAVLGTLPRGTVRVSSSAGTTIDELAALTEALRAVRRVN